MVANEVRIYVGRTSAHGVFVKKDTARLEAHRII